MKSRKLASCLLISAGLVLGASWSAVRADSSEAPSNSGSSDKKPGSSSSSDSGRSSSSDKGTSSSSDSTAGRSSSSDKGKSSSADSTGGRSSSSDNKGSSSGSDSTAGRSSGGSNSSESDSTPTQREKDPPRKTKVVGKGKPGSKSADKEPKESNDPPGTDKERKKLDDWFAKCDLNKDGYLDRQELAKAMHYLSTWKDAPKDGEGNPTNLPRSVMARRDYKLFAALDNNNDQKVSKEEFDIWAKDYAVELAKYNNDVAARQKQQERSTRRIMDPLGAQYLDYLDAMNDAKGADKAAPSPFKKPKKKLRP